MKTAGLFYLLAILSYGASKTYANIVCNTSQSRLLGAIQKGQAPPPKDLYAEICKPPPEALNSLTQSFSHRSGSKLFVVSHAAGDLDYLLRTKKPLDQSVCEKSFADIDQQCVSGGRTIADDFQFKIVIKHKYQGNGEGFSPQKANHDLSLLLGAHNRETLD